MREWAWGESAGYLTSCRWCCVIEDTGEGGLGGEDPVGRRSKIQCQAGGKDMVLRDFPCRNLLSTFKKPFKGLEGTGLELVWRENSRYSECR